MFTASTALQKELSFTVQITSDWLRLDTSDKLIKASNARAFPNNPNADRLNLNEKLAEKCCFSFYIV
jgi:hypothetical protein